MTDKAYPFLFLGQGFGTSYKCLEGYLWFVAAPTAVQQKQIIALMPKPVLLGARFDTPTILHFGSDDRLPAFVRAAYNPAYAKRPFAEAVEELEEIWQADPDDVRYYPTRRDWKAFCDDFERVVRAVHRISPLALALKPDDGEWGMKLGPWHRWSVKNAGRIAERAAREQVKTSRAMSFLAANMFRDVLRRYARRRTSAERVLWLHWLDKLVAEGDEYVRETFVEHAASLLRSFPERERATLEAELRPVTRKRLAAAGAEDG
jgi:hypothetical protein